MDALAYSGPSPTVLRNGRHVAPGTPIDPEELEPAADAVEADEENGVEAKAAVPAERDLYEENGWLEEITLEDDPSELRGEALKARADELEIEGRSNMRAHELRAAIAAAEENTTAPGAEGGES